MSDSNCAPAAREGMGMDDGQRSTPEDHRPRLLPATGSVIGGIRRDKVARITDAITDLQLGMAGLRSQVHGLKDGERWTQVLAAFARTCSVFLRKTVLGDFDKRESRLLDDRILDSIELRFDRLRKIPRDKRRRIEMGFDLSYSVFEATKLNEATGEPEATYHFHAGPQALELSIEWPLLGAADWTGVPCDESPWLVSPEQLFETADAPALSCDEWLGQQVVLFDGKGISLKEIIRTVVNFEGAHSIDVGRLATVEEEKLSRAGANPAPHILNAVTLFGIRYAHMIVIECAVYLYKKLLKESSIPGPKGDVYVVRPGVTCPPEQAESACPNWMKFRGEMMISFSSAPKVIRHEIKAVK